jgi:hypothetical protein
MLRGCKIYVLTRLGLPLPLVVVADVVLIISSDLRIFNNHNHIFKNFNFKKVDLRDAISPRFGLIGIIGLPNCNSWMSRGGSLVLVISLCAYLYMSEMKGGTKAEVVTKLSLVRLSFTLS